MTTVRCAAEGDECVYVEVPRDHAVGVHGASAATGCFRRALTGRIDPPYRAVARRRKGDLWVVGAVRIDVAELPDLKGEELTMVQHPDGKRELVVDGRPQLVGAAALAPLAGERFDAYVLRARHVGEGFWELTVDPL